MSELIGLDAKLYYGTAGTTASSELTIVREVNVNLEAGEADMSTRGSGAWGSVRATLLRATLEIEILNKTEDPGYQALKTAFLTRGLVALVAKDAETGEGLDADFAVLNFSRAEPLEDAQTVSVSLKPNTSLRTPVWID